MDLRPLFIAKLSCYLRQYNTVYSPLQGVFLIFPAFPPYIPPFLLTFPVAGIKIRLLEEETNAITKEEHLMMKKTAGILSGMLVLSLLNAPDGWASSLRAAPEIVNVSESSEPLLSRKASYEKEIADLINAKRDLLLHGSF